MFLNKGFGETASLYTDRKILHEKYQSDIEILSILMFCSPLSEDDLTPVLDACMNNITSIYLFIHHAYYNARGNHTLEKDEVCSLERFYTLDKG